MKNIRVYTPEKYASSDYEKVDENIYRQLSDGTYVTSLSFEQEPELGESDSPQEISQYPLEDILDKFYTHIEDFYDELNAASDSTCYLEFGGTEIDDIKGVLGLVGKHVYNRENDEGTIDLVIE
ncbi:hypothetical protein [Micrococcoides hystricis]|uniref:Uncharacterized protein n=1 Tax=Micrococcoides hystricis TaxID=1572761 RepID=A0ABV6PA35_9MICC